MTGRSLPMATDEPTDAQLEKIGDIADEALANATSKVVNDKSLDPMTLGLRILGVFKFILQLIVRTLLQQGLSPALIKESLVEVIDDELSACQRESGNE